MKILFLTSRLPYPPHRGDRVRTFNFLKRLSSDHEIHVVSFIESDDEKKLFPALEPFCTIETVRLGRRSSFLNMLTRAASSLPLQVLYYHSDEMRQKVERLTKEVKFDLIYTHLFRMVPFTPVLPGAVRILDLTDCISRELAASLPYRPRLLRIPLKMEINRVRRYEAEVATQFDEVWTISESDREAIAQMAQGSPIRVVPNGVESALFNTEPNRDGSRMGFLGNFSVFHNIDAATFLALDIMPLVREAVPGATLDLIGHGLTDAVRRLAGRNGVRVTGPVEHLQDGFAPLTLFLSPLRFAAGIQNKIVEAMAAGLPVVTTSFGNRGLQAIPEEEIIVRDDPGQFADAVIDLLKNRDRASRIGMRGREFVRKKYSWDAVADRVHALDRAKPAQVAPMPQS